MCLLTTDLEELVVDGAGRVLLDSRLALAALGAVRQQVSLHVPATARHVLLRS